MFDSFLAIDYNSRMTVLPLLHFFSALVFLYLSVYAVIKNPQALVNRLFALVLSCFTVWSSSYIFFHSPATSKETALLFFNISAVGWVGFSSFLLVFIMAFCQKKEFLKKWWFYPAVFALPLFFLIQQWNGNMFTDIHRYSFGWKPVFTPSLVVYGFYLHYFLFTLLGIIIIINFTHKTENFSLKKQGKITYTTIIIALILGSISDFLLPAFQLENFPDIGNFFVLIWAIGVVYAMAKYKFLIITPVTAAENIISTIFDCLILLDMKGCIVRVNKATLNLSQFIEKELIGNPVTMLFRRHNPNETTFYQDSLLTEIIKTEERQNNELILCSKDGRDIPVLFSSSMLKDENNNAVGYVCVAKDITERKKLEDETLKAKKLESIGVLAGGIAHDFNNLLAVIIGNMALAREEMEGDSEGLSFLENAEEAANIAAELAGKFITFSRGGWMNKEKISLSFLLKDIVLPVPTKADGQPNVDVLRRITLQIEFPDSLNPVYGDESQMLQVIQSLLLNAVEAFPGDQKGKITILGENMTVEEKTPLPLKPGAYVKLTVRDNGKGIVPEYHEKVFDPYFSTKDLTSQKGMGLGLTICYSIIKKHEGHIVIDSKTGFGTSVHLYLPAFSRE